jgi:hypothetical protein
MTTDETPFLGDVKDLALQADLVMVGTVTQTLPSAWGNRKSATDITTDYTIRVDQRIAGNAGSSVRLRRSGGQIGCVHLANAVAPTLHDGDHLLLFMRQDETPGLPPAYRILGEGQGYWQVKTRTEAGSQIEVAIKYFTSDSGTFGESDDFELLQDIVDRVHRAQATGTPVPDPTDGIGFHVSVDYASGVPPEAWVPTSRLIVMGKVVGVLPAQWTTPDGQRPANLLQSVPGRFTIITPVVIQLDSAPLVNSYGPLMTSREIVVATERGQVGANIVEFGSTFMVGEHVLLTLSFFRPLGGGFGRFMTPRGFAWNAGAKFVIAGDKIYSPYPNTKPQSLDEFVERIKAVVQATPTVSP